MQGSLFDTSTNLKVEKNINFTTLNDISLLSEIKGLTYLPNYISQEEAEEFWKSINDEQWLGDLKRRVQHYGYKYDYRARFIDYSMKIGDIPNWIAPLAEKLKEEKYMAKVPDQLIINEYKPGQGIANHVDCEPCFDDTIISLSLGSACVMNFINKYTKEKINVLLEPRSLVILKEDARYKWTHGIAGKKTDTFNEEKYERQTRISLTFRNVILDSCNIK